ncbi:carbohydrate-binding domain-containing protein [Tsukamurella tyrosinosolvens]|uniref:carbohydrate-binding domain-containing protein n=1 Tax=Tsukamurella tyrosinosolvens TaxID=57704 RepID=UPI00368DE49C
MSDGRIDPRPTIAAAGDRQSSVLRLMQLWFNALRWAEVAGVIQWPPMMLQDSEHPEESAMTRRSWSFRMTIAAVVAALTTTCLAAAVNADTTVGPSGMTVTPSSAGGQVSDWRAGTVVKLWSNGAVSIPVVTANAGGKLEIRARGEICRGAPVMAVKRGGATLATVTLGSGWSTYSVGLGAQAGSSPVTLEFTNDYRWWFCDRNLYIASVSVRDGAVTPTPTPTPTTTVPTTTVPTTTVPTTTVPTTTVPTTTVPTTIVPTTTVPTTTATATQTGGPDPSTGCPVNMYQARYFNNTTATGNPVAVQCENAPGGTFFGVPLSGVNQDNFSVDYNGVIDVPATGEYFVSTSLGNVTAKVWIDDALALEKPSTYWGTTNVQRTMQKGRHKVRLTYANASGIAHVGFAIPRATPGVPSNNGNYFSADSFWNQPVPVDAKVDPRSAGWISALDARSNGAWVNTSEWTTTVYNAPPGTPTIDVRVTNTNRLLTIPYLPTYRPTNDADHHMAVIDDASGCLYEFQGFNSSDRSAAASASYRAYTGSGGHDPAPGHAGGEFSYLAGLITPQDVESGVIDHALRYAMPGNSPNYVYPGTRSDGTTLGGVPEGTRLQLDPNLDLSRFGLSPFQLMLARALQVYGGLNADHADLFVFYARSTNDGSSYAQPIQQLPDALLQHLRFLAPSISSTDIYLDRSDDPGCNQQR